MNWKEQSIADMTSTKPIDFERRMKYICTTGDLSFILVGDLDMLCGTIRGRMAPFYMDDGFGNAICIKPEDPAGK